MLRISEWTAAKFCVGVQVLFLASIGLNRTNGFDDGYVRPSKMLEQQTATKGIENG